VEVCPCPARVLTEKTHPPSMNPSEPVRYPSLEGGIDAIFACLSFFHLNGNLGLGERRNGWGFLFRFYHLLGRFAIFRRRRYGEGHWLYFWCFHLCF